MDLDNTEGWYAALPPAGVGFLQSTDIETINDLNNKPSEVIFQQPFAYAGKDSGGGAP